MNLSNLLQDHHISKRLSKSTFNQHQAQSAKSYGRDMASALTASPYQTNYIRTSQPSPSPTSEDCSGCTLPSIQSLIGMADAPNQEQQAELERQAAQSFHQSDGGQSGYGQSTVSSLALLPPGAGLGSNFDVDGSIQSPSTASSHSSSAPLQYYATETDLHQQRLPPTSSHTGISIPSQSSQPQYQQLQYHSSPGSISNYSYSSSANQSGTPMMFYQRSLSSNFSTPNTPEAITPTLSNTHERSPVENSNPWQHHHYISPSSTASITVQPADRYVCQTCSKSFSRPSSLRIHSYSHTGEKPFKCAHNGCGKAFSVRSNMKRHERGCHGGESPGSA